MRHGTFDAFGGDQTVRATAAGQPVDACFADEVAIDFPSLARAVRRMRRPFVADLRPVALSAIIQLSRQEALAGTSVSLQVPVRSECRPCGGRGESWSGLCPTCGGAGVTLRYRAVVVTMPAGVRDGSWHRMTLAPGRTPPTRIELRVLVAA